ncbi:hypothetical protein PINS_up005790 [Pythium insidiosum]|nr:hypothetical protein PINS_up005790 [Pythium insidiosum]
MPHAAVVPHHETALVGPATFGLGNTKGVQRSASSFSVLIDSASSRSGLVSTLIYAFFAAIIAVSALGLTTLANKPVHLGVVEQSWFHDISEIPINTLLEGQTSIKTVKQTAASSASKAYGSESLADLQYDECGIRDEACASKVRPNTELVLSVLGSSFHLVASFELPEYAAHAEDIEFKYVNTLAGFNFPVVQFYLPGHQYAVVCSVRRNRFWVAQDLNTAEIDSVAICSKREYDPDWGCENEVAPETPSHVFKINNGKTVYLGQTQRRELYYNPGNTARLTGGPNGIGLLATVIGVDEYNEGILQASAPWDVAPAYLCKGTLDRNANTGMRWQGQGVVSMIWRPSSLMTTNAFVLWAITTGLSLLQYFYLSRSSVSVIPVNLSKTLVGPVVLMFACYGNYNVQVLTTYLEINKVTTFNAEPYRLCGPLIMASTIGVMSGAAMQMVFNPLLVSPSFFLTIVSVANWVLVFVLEAFVFAKQSTTVPTACVEPNSSSCSSFTAPQHNYFLSVLFAALLVSLSCVAIVIIRRQSKIDVSPTNSVLRVLAIDSVRDIATSGLGIVRADKRGVLSLDSGVLLQKNMVRVSPSCVVRTANAKYCAVYRLVPVPLKRIVNRFVGSALVCRADEERLTGTFCFLELKSMDLESSSEQRLSPLLQ